MEPNKLSRLRVAGKDDIKANNTDARGANKNKLNIDLDNFFSTVTKVIIICILILSGILLTARTIDLILPESMKWMTKEGIDKIDFLFGTIIAGTGGGYISNLIRKHTTDEILSPENKEKFENLHN